MMLLLVHFRVSTLKLMFPQPFLVMIAVLYLLDDCYVKCRIHYIGCLSFWMKFVTLGFNISSWFMIRRINTARMLSSFSRNAKKVNAVSY